MYDSLIMQLLHSAAACSLLDPNIFLNALFLETFSPNSFFSKTEQTQPSHTHTHTHTHAQAHIHTHKPHTPLTHTYHKVKLYFCVL